MPDKTLKNPPLTYVLAQVKITPIEDIKSYKPKIQEAIRKEFPISKEINFQTFEIIKESDPIFHQATHWHFKNEKATTGIIIDKQTINLHTSKYSNFEKFIKEFEGILKKLNKQLDISLVTRLGLRYVNVIRSNLEQFVENELLGFYEKDRKFLAKTDTIMEEPDGSTIKTSSTHVGNKSGLDQYKLVSPDLTPVAEQLSFKHHTKPKDEYVIIDIDCGHIKQLDFKKVDFQQEFTKLHNNIERIFHKTVTKEAIKNWS